MIWTFLRGILYWAIIFFFHRLVLMCLLTPTDFADGTSWWEIFACGLRFDLMVTAYLCAPPLLALLVPLLSGWPGPRMRLFWHRTYMILMALAVSVVTGLDFVAFSKTGDRWNQNWNFAAALRFDDWSGALWAAELGLFLLLIHQVRRWVKIDLDLSQVTGVRWVFCAALLVVMGRGSFGPYHLDLRFAEISSSVTVQRVVVPSCYAFDQALRHRR